MITTRKHVRRSAGFTLAEMLIVLAILAITTTIAVQSLAPIADQARFDATVRTLNNLSSAIVSSSQTGTASAVSGFVADMARLPNTYNTTTDALDINVLLNDLFVQPTDRPAFQYWTTNISSWPVPLGWRGPYVFAPAGATSNAITDGWGQPLSLQTPLIAGAISIVSSGPPTLSVATPITVNLMQQSCFAVGITGTFAIPSSSMPSGSNSWAVAIIGSGPSYTTGTSSTGASTSDIPYTVVSIPTPAPSSAGATTYTSSINVTSTDIAKNAITLPVGPRVIQAIYTTAASPTYTSSWTIAGNGTYYNVLPGMNTINLQ